MNEINENNSKKNIHNDPDLYLKLFEDNDIKEELIDNEIENNKIMKENILDQIKNYKNILNENHNQINKIKENKNIIDEEIEITEIDLREKENIEINNNTNIYSKINENNQMNEIKENIMKLEFLNNEINKNIDKFNIKKRINYIDIEKREFDILIKPNEWLNDNIINSYLSLIQNNFKNNTYFYNDLYIKVSNYYKNYNFQGVKRYTKHIHIFEKEKIIFPINIQNHWIMCYIDVKDNLFYYLDPKYGTKYIRNL